MSEPTAWVTAEQAQAMLAAHPNMGPVLANARALAETVIGQAAALEEAHRLLDECTRHDLR